MDNFVCNICPRHCNVNRSVKKGFCGLSNNVKVALAKVHYGEEPIISGIKGSGTIFFSGCNLKCVYCQNYNVSHNNYGKEISVKRLAEIFKELEKKGVNNINLVSPTPYAFHIIKALKLYKPKVPVVYNTHGYEDVNTLKALRDYVDIYLTDFKYANNTLGKKYSNVPDYFTKTLEAIKQMKNNQPENIIENDVMKKGVIIRHLVLPNNTQNSVEVLDAINTNFGNEEIISIMAQYTPCGKSCEIKELERKITKLEYKRVLTHLHTCGFKNGFIQELSSSGQDEIPNFNCDGV